MRFIERALEVPYLREVTDEGEASLPPKVFAPDPDEGEPEVVADGGLETIPVERLRLSQVVWFVEFDGELRTSVGTVRDYEIEFSMQAISELLIRQPRAVESERWQVALSRRRGAHSGRPRPRARRRCLLPAD